MSTDHRPPALMLAPETPYPLTGGGALRTASLLNYLARGHQVDLVVFRQPGAPDPAKDLPPGLVRRTAVIDLPHHWRNTPARVLRNAARITREVPPLVDRFGGFERQVSEALAGKRYAIGVIEHSWCAPYWPQVARVSARTILDLHNIESTLHQRCAATEDYLSAFAHHVFQKASLRLERQWFPRFSQVLAPSSEDAALARLIAPTARVAVYPNAIPWTPLPPQADENVIVFSGNMEYHPNRTAVRFFRREVWPLLRERFPDLIWRLLGKNPDAIRQFTSGDSRIEIQGQVDHAVRELARARVAVVPLLAGSGTRLKVLEAWAAGLPVVSTTIGAEGLPVRDGVHLFLADQAPVFAESVARLLTCKELRNSLGMAGRLLLEKEFTWGAAWGSLDF